MPLKSHGVGGQSLKKTSQFTTRISSPANSCDFIFIFFYMAKICDDFILFLFFFMKSYVIFFSIYFILSFFNDLLFNFLILFFFLIFSCLSTHNEGLEVHPRTHCAEVRAWKAIHAFK